MRRQAHEYTRCPACGRKTVLLFSESDGYEFLRCRQSDCAWEMPAEPGPDDKASLEQIEKWKRVNRDDLVRRGEKAAAAAGRFLDTQL